MKLLTFLQDGREQPGVLDRAGTGVLPLESLGLPFESVLSLIETASHEQMQLLHQATQDPARQGSSFLWSSFWPQSRISAAT